MSLCTFMLPEHCRLTWIVRTDVTMNASSPSAHLRPPAPICAHQGNKARMNKFGVTMVPIFVQAALVYRAVRDVAIRWSCELGI